MHACAQIGIASKKLLLLIENKRVIQTAIVQINDKKVATFTTWYWPAWHIDYNHNTDMKASPGVRALGIYLSSSVAI